MATEPVAECIEMGAHAPLGKRGIAGGDGIDDRGMRRGRVVERTEPRILLHDRIRPTRREAAQHVDEQLGRRVLCGDGDHGVELMV
jgi:hypothetical protein